MQEKFNTIPEIIADIRAGKMVIMLDDHDRENEGDFVMAAEKITAEAINFMALYGRGLICTPVNTELAQKLSLTPMVHSNTALHETAFTITIDAKEGISTGISARDRAHTIKLMLGESTSAQDFSMPGHIFPLIAKDGGVLKRRGHTEAAVDLAKLSGFKSAGVICEILREDGEQARGAELFEVARRFNLKIGTISDLAEYISSLVGLSKLSINEISRIDFPNKYGNFKLSIFTSPRFPGEEHLAIHLGMQEINTRILVRLHSECLTGDVFGSLRCDCGEQLENAMIKMAEKGQGLFIYLKQEGRGIGLVEKIKAYALQEKGFDTVEANLELGHPVDKRSYEFAGLILDFFGIKEVELLTNNPAKINELNELGFKVLRCPLFTPPNIYNQHYLLTKKEKMGHLLN